MHSVTFWQRWVVAVAVCLVGFAALGAPGAHAQGDVPDKFLFAIGAERASAGELNYPQGVAAAPDGTVYVADRDNHRIQRFSKTGAFLGKWGSEGTGDGHFYYPYGVAVAPDGTVYVADTGNRRIQRFSSTGAFLGKWGSEGEGDGQFNGVYNVAAAPDGTVYVADAWNHRIQHFSATGAFLGRWGSGGAGDGQFKWPQGVAVGSNGTVYVADTWNDRIQWFGPTGAFLGKWGSEGWGDGQFSYPEDVAMAADGTVYVADAENQRIQHFGATGTFLGKWGFQGAGDGQFDGPYGVAAASDGTVYVADIYNHRIQRFSSTGAFLGKWGSEGWGDSQFDWAGSVATALDGTVYVADAWNHRVQAFGWSYPDTWRGEYYANPYLTGAPALIRQDSALDFHWGSGSPGAGVPTDGFSARWQRYMWFQAGTYHLTFRSDDGVRCWLDDRLILDEWQWQVAEFERTVSVSRGYHRLRIEYYDKEGDAAFSLAISFSSGIALPIVVRQPTPIATLTPTPRPTEELYYDDEIYDSMQLWRAAAVRFSVNEHRQLLRLRYHLRGNPGPVQVVVYDANWSVLYRADVTPGGSGHRWFEHDVGASVMVGPGDFYVGIVWPSAGAEPQLDEDATDPDLGRSYGDFRKPDPPFPTLHDQGYDLDLMIHAVVQ